MELIDTKLAEQMLTLKMVKMLFTLYGWLQDEDEENIAKTNFIKKLQKQADEEIFTKKSNLRILTITVLYLIKKFRRFILK